MFYIVATPIGNLKELTLRAIDILNEVDYILCEDTRTSRILLNEYGIKKPLKSYHKFNERESVPKIVNDLKKNVNIALISDAGMPTISDPGNILIQALIKENINYTVCSGASAFVNAFVLSGFDTPFTFVGFLPDTNKKKFEMMDNIKPINTTLIFYCSPHSLISDLNFLYQSLGDRNICVVREISKKFEEKIFTTLKNGYNGVVKGEFVVVIEKANKSTQCTENIDKELKTLLDLGLSKTEASKVISKIHGIKKSEVYKNTIQQK